jgi:hypothetical protein
LVPAKPEKHIGNSHELSQIERLLDSPFTLANGEASPRSAGRVSQQEHHRTRTFQEEYHELLRRHGVDFDEQYVWE